MIFSVFFSKRRLFHCVCCFSNQFNFISLAFDTEIDGEYDKELKTIDKVANEFKRLCCMNGEAAACFGAHERWR